MQTTAALSVQDERFAKWGALVECSPRRLTSDERDSLTARLDAAVAHLYGLSEDDLAHVYETFHEGADYSDHADLVASNFRDLKGQL